MSLRSSPPSTAPPPPHRLPPPAVVVVLNQMSTMEGYGVSQQADEGYSEDPLNPQPESSAFATPYKPRDGAPSSNPLSGSSSAQAFNWMTSHIASLPTEIRART